MRDGKRIGRILQHHGGPRDGKWSWYVQRDFQVKGRLNNGTEDTLEQAKAAFKAAVSDKTLGLRADAFAGEGVGFSSIGANVS